VIAADRKPTQLPLETAFGLPGLGAARSRIPRADHVDELSMPVPGERVDRLGRDIEVLRRDSQADPAVPERLRRALGDA